MKSRSIWADSMLLLAAAIWGFGVVAQRSGMAHLGPYLFTAVRFLVGGIVLVPFVFLLGWRRRKELFTRRLFAQSVLGGFVFALASLTQQVGIVYTTAGNAGFITGLYVVFVPIIGAFLGKGASRWVWLGALLASIGLLLLSGAGEGTRFVLGDLLVLVSAVLWAVYFIVVGSLVTRHRALPLAAVMFIYCGLFSLIPALFLDDWSLAAFRGGWRQLAYSSLLSITVAFTLQIAAQKNTKPTHAALISSLEGVFAVIGGVMLLGEALGARKIVGCLTMLAAFVLIQVGRGRKGRLKSEV